MGQNWLGIQQKLFQVAMQKKNDYRIYLSPPHQSGKELDYLKKALDSNWLAPGGAHVQQFESELKKITNRKYCIALNSGTAAIHLALMSLGVGAGDYVICQTFGFVAIANPIAYLGAFPIFIDSETDTWNMNPMLLEKAIIDLKKNNIVPKAILYAHIYGSPAKANDLMDISDKYQIPLVEDAAEALGAKINSKPVGQFGKISILSFNGNKVVTTSGGGALLTDDLSISTRTLLLSSQARNESKPYLHTEVGYNYRMSNLSASLGLAQLSCLKEWVEQKRRIFETYHELNSKENLIGGIQDHSEMHSNRWLSAFLVKSSKKQREIIDALEARKIETRRFWKPLHLLNIYKGQRSYISGVANELFKKGICLPSGVGLNKEEQNEIIQIISALD
jgi:dTDP-4-amino-4,6-dideoxygalactose transaminase